LTSGGINIYSKGLEVTEQLKMPRGKMSAQGLKRAAIILSIVALVLAWVGAEGSAWFCRPYGTVNYRGEPAPNGLKVVAFIQNTPLDTCETQNGAYRLMIPKDDPETAEKEGWADGDIITVQVDGYTALPSFKAFEGEKQINLYLPTLDVKLTTWGKIKALFR
jgi:hypothetical protein